jgi:hypothetical protein
MKRLIQTVLVSSFLAASSITYAQSVAQPGDPVIASSANSPGSEGVANAIDGKPTKYLNFDGSNSNPSGFIVSPSLGKTLVTGLSMQTANDAPDRDVKVVTLEGSNDAETTAWDAGNWELIAQIDDIPASQAVVSASLDPSSVTTLTSRSGASFAVCIERPVTSVLPKDGETINPDGLLLLPSKLRYFVGFPSIAFATPSDPGLFAEEAMTGSPG